MSKPAKVKWYWISDGTITPTQQGGWVHAGPCLFAVKLQGYDCEPERRPQNWTKRCPICGGCEDCAKDKELL